MSHLAIDLVADLILKKLFAGWDLLSSFSFLNYLNNNSAKLNIDRGFGVLG